MKRFQFITIFAAMRLLVLVLVLAPSAFAQGFPNKPIRIVVPYPAGGSTDLIARLIAEPMSKSMGQPVIVENRPGAAGQVASSYVAKAAPDGYTLLATNLGPAALAYALNAKLSYHPVNDFAPVSLTGMMPLVIAVGGSSPFRTVGDLIAAAKAQPGKLNDGTTGNGSLSHVVFALFNSTAGIKVEHIAYKGGGEVATAAITGDVAYVVGPPSDYQALMSAGKLRPIAMTSAQRSALMPGVPTVAEAGLPGFEVEYWNGIMAPARTPAAVIGVLNKAIGAALENPDVKAKMASVQVQPTHSTPERFQALVQEELTKWTRVVQTAGIQIE